MLAFGNYGVADSTEMFAASSATVYTDGAVPGYSSSGSRTGSPGVLGVNITASGISGGDVAVAVQTAPSEADADDEWIDTGLVLAVDISANGNYSLVVSEDTPIMDKVRLKYTANAFTGTLAARWVCDAVIQAVAE